jgi:hypothetical protein
MMLTHHSSDVNASGARNELPDSRDPLFLDDELIPRIARIAYPVLS